MTANPSSENQSAAASTQDVRGSGLSVASRSPLPFVGYSPAELHYFWEPGFAGLATCDGGQYAAAQQAACECARAHPDYTESTSVDVYYEAAGRDAAISAKVVGQRGCLFLAGSAALTNPTSGRNIVPGDQSRIVPPALYVVVRVPADYATAMGVDRWVSANRRISI